jgi:nitrogenase molybdenum-iron protein alpha/beta subunit
MTPFAEGALLAVNAVSDLRVRASCREFLKRLSKHDWATTLGSRLGKTGMELPAGRGDRFAGYAAMLETLAETLDLSGARPRPDAVAVIGLWMDRCEGDGTGNAAELRRLCRALGFKHVPVWPSGGALEDVREASVIVSLPHARKAAAMLARRLGATLVQTQLPVGLAYTQAFVRALARVSRRQKEAEAFIDAELRRIIPRLEWVVPYSFLSRSVLYEGDAHVAGGLRQMLDELGMRFSRDGEADLVIADSETLARLKPKGAWMELGFPSLRTHFLRDEPYLGFEGYLSLAHRMSNAIAGVS